nr:MAG TPA: hypothetical protein [Caudoviricetes sp.]
MSKQEKKYRKSIKLALITGVVAWVVYGAVRVWLG